MTQLVYYVYVSRLEVKQAMKLAIQLMKDGMTRKEALLEAWKRVKGK